MCDAECIVSSVTLDEYEHTTSFVAIGIFYQRPTVDASTKKRIGPCFDFWGFIGGNVLRARNCDSDTIGVKREWCSMTIEGCHASFDGYMYAMHNDATTEMDLETFEWAMAARIQLYHVVSGRYTGANDVPVRHGSRLHRMLHLVDAESVLLDRAGYRAVMMFVACKTHAFANRPANNAFMSAWHRAEHKLFGYRIAHFTQANAESIMSKLDVKQQVQKVDCNAEYQRLMQNESNHEHSASLRASLPATGHRYKAPFEMVLALVASRSAWLYDGVAYMSDYGLYAMMLDAVQAIHVRNMASVVDSREDMAWTEDERTRRTYAKCFMPLYTAVIVHYGFTLLAKKGAQGSVAVSTADDAIHVKRLELVLASSPPCMSALMDRAMNTKVAAHNNYQDRSNAIQYIMRMSIPVHIVKPRIQAKVMISYDKPDGEWKSIENSINFEEKRMKNPKDGKGVFVPPCHWIIAKGGSATSLVCPYAARMSSGPASQAISPDRLVTASKAACHRRWQHDAQIKGDRASYSPDEYTNTLMLQKQKKIAIAVDSKRKAP